MTVILVTSCAMAVKFVWSKDLSVMITKTVKMGRMNGTAVRSLLFIILFNTCALIDLFLFLIA